MQNNNSSNKILRDYVMKNDKKSEIFHSSGYAEAQNGENIGTASTGLSMAERKALEEKRQFVAKYNTSRMFSETFSNRKAKKFNLPDRRDQVRTNVTGDASGNVRVGFGRSAGNVRGIGEAGGYTPIKSGGGPSSAIKPGGITPSIRPKF